MALKAKPSATDPAATLPPVALAALLRQMESAFELCVRMSSLLSLDQALDYVVGQIAEIVEADTVSVLMLDESRRHLEIAACWGIKDEAAAAFSLQRGAGVAGSALEEGKSVVVEDTSTDPRFAVRAGVTRPPARLAAVPLLYVEQKFGVLCVERPLRLPPFGEAEMRCLSLVAAQLASCIRNARLVASLEERVRHLSMATEIGKLLVSTLDLNAVLELIVDGVAQVTGADRCSIMLLEQDHLRIAAALGLPEEVRQGARVRLGEGIAGWVAAHGRSLLISDIDREDRFRRAEAGRYKAKSLLSVPLLYKERVQGVINVNSTDPARVWTESDESLLTHFAGQAAIAIENARLYQQLEELATTDPVTGINNHRAFQEALGSELSRAERHGQHVSLLLLDVDHFKRINDELGHQRGDAVLRRVGALLSQQLRSMDTVARYGGEEFAVIMPQTAKTDALRSAERLRAAVESEFVNILPESGGMTISIGVSTFPDDAAAKDELIRAADAALYRAKHRGRNRVEAA